MLELAAFLLLLAVAYLALVTVLVVFINWVERRHTAADAWWLPGHDQEDK